MFPSIALLAALTQLASPNDAYRAALATMGALPVPAYLTYRTDLDPGDATVSLTFLADGRIKPRVVVGGSYAASSFRVIYRSSDGLAAIETDPGRGAFTSNALFDPTWNGVSLWLRRGMLATLAREPPTAPQSGPSAAPMKMPPTILTVYAFDPNAYGVEDAGVAWCGADPGRLLRLRALRDAERHPLQRIVIDAVDGRVCMVRFAVAGAEGPSRFDGYVDLQLGSMAGYYLITGGYLDVDVVQAGARVGFAHVRFHNRDARAFGREPSAGSR